MSRVPSSPNTTATAVSSSVRARTPQPITASPRRIAPSTENASSKATMELHTTTTATTTTTTATSPSARRSIRRHQATAPALPDGRDEPARSWISCRSIHRRSGWCFRIVTRAPGEGRSSTTKWTASASITCLPRKFYTTAASIRGRPTARWVCVCLRFVC